MLCSLPITWMQERINQKEEKKIQEIMHCTRVLMQSWKVWNSNLLLPFSKFGEDKSEYGGEGGDIQLIFPTAKKQQCDFKLGTKKELRLPFNTTLN